MLNFKSIATFTFATLTPLMAIAQSLTMTSGIPEGSFKGKFRGQDRGGVHMMTQNIKGCQGCFIAIVFKHQTGLFASGDTQVQSYKALPQNDFLVEGKRTATQYTLSPIGVDTDGELTTPNDNPSLVLNVTSHIGTPEVEFTVTNAQSDNRTGFQSSMIFKGNESPFDLSEGKEGRYKKAWAGREEGTISIIGQNFEDGSRSANVTWNGNKNEAGGTFYLKEKAPGVFTFTAVSYLATGTQAKSLPTKVVIFVKRDGRERALLVNPNNGADISELKVMNQ
jgi:hypothetical protein